MSKAHLRRGERRPAVIGDPKAGYSLLEILIVLTIIALIAALVGPRLFAQLDKSKVTAARVQARQLQAALDTMRLDIGRYPTQQEGLTLLTKADAQQLTGWYGPYIDGGVPQDPWSRDYVYTAPTSVEGRPQIASLGADGQPGGQGLSADIVANPEQAPAAAAPAATAAAERQSEGS